ncbi:MAG: type II toxin-antitoxin system RelE/ParE family toxin [Akkermansiaceae bacterium]|jgi:toxin ParE1/3/4|nr:type II toxin-antitoxin system RelE/ParE family toxin [Akkermansiaceae bacterium]
MARLVWTDPALQDLEQIADYIALDDDAAARRLVKKVFAQAAQLEDFPEMCPKPHDLPDTAYRHLIIDPLRIFYRVQDDLIYIVYVMRHEKHLRISDIQERD